MLVYIEIDATPKGEAPVWVRDAWIGCVFPARRGGTHMVYGVLSGAIAVEEGYAVATHTALEQLERRGCTGAAAWWRENLAPWALVGELVFSRECCREIGVPAEQERA
ncbi:MAG: hypothetical protein WD850_02795 [Candidatus Spechtbacterales bacterium]